MFEGPHATNIFRDSSFQWSIPPVSPDRGGRVWRSQCILLGWRGFRNVVLSLISAKTWLSVSVSCLMFSVVSLWFLSASCLLASIVASMESNWSLDLVSILLPPFVILKLGVLRVVVYCAYGR